VLSQAAAGLFLGGAALAAGTPATFDVAKAPLAVVAFALLNLGLAVSVLHLGRPLGAWRAFLGLGTSWMSREIFAFGLFATAAAAFTGASLWDLATGLVPKLHALESFGSPAQLAGPLAIITAALGLLGVFCSAMIYVDTHRSFWNRAMVFTKFFGTTALLGAAGASAVLASISAFTGGAPWRAAAVSACLFLLLRTALLGWEFVTLRQMVTVCTDPNHRSGRIIWHLLRPKTFAGLAAIAASMILSAAAIFLAGAPAAVCAILSFLCACLSQGVERYFFFTAVVAPRMPGPLISGPRAHA